MKPTMIKKIITSLLCFCFIFSLPQLSSHASMFSVVYVAWDMAKEAWRALPSWGQTADFTCNEIPVLSTWDRMCKERNLNNHKGFKKPMDVKKLLKKVVDGDSIDGTPETKIYGQDKAKSQIIPIVMDALYNIKDMQEDKFRGKKTGNVIYIHGEPGTGKTTLGEVIAKSSLNNHEKTFVEVDSTIINDRYSLADQLFGTVGSKNIKEKYAESISEIEKRCKILSHVLKWPESVILINDFDKMKLKSDPRSHTASQIKNCDENDVCKDEEGKREDKTADEILKDISTTGKYSIGDTEIDVSKVIFIVTTNENRKELEENFGTLALKDNGILKLDAIKFEPLKLEDCRRIVIDIINEVRARLTDVGNDFKIGYFHVSDDTIDSLAKVIQNNEKQGRIKKNIKRQIMSLFTEGVGEEIGNQYELIYNKVNSDPLHISNFSKRKISGKTCLNLQKVNVQEGKVDSFSDKCSCDTCMTFVIPFENFYERLDEFTKGLPLGSKQGTLDEIKYLLKKEIKDQRFLDNNCLIITINTKAKHQNYVTLKFSKKETFGTFENGKLKSIFAPML